MQGCKLTKELGPYARGSAGVFGSTLFDPRDPFKNKDGNKIRDACEKLQVAGFWGYNPV